MEFACSTDRETVVGWSRQRESIRTVTPISTGEHVLTDPEHYSISPDESDMDRRIFNLVIESMTDDMVGDTYYCHTDGMTSRLASLRQKGKDIITTHNMHILDKLGKFINHLIT